MTNSHLQFLAPLLGKSLHLHRRPLLRRDPPLQQVSGLVWTISKWDNVAAICPLP